MLSRKPGQIAVIGIDIGKNTLDQSRLEPSCFEPEGECWSGDPCTRDQYSLIVYRRRTRCSVPM
jgi:hypothetical protein